MHLSFNIFPVTIPKSKIQVGILKYPGKNEFKEIRYSKAGTHLFVGNRKDKDGNDCIWSVPLLPESEKLGGSFEEIGLEKHLNIASNLIRETLIGSFGKLEIPFLDVQPIEFVYTRPNPELLRNIIGEACPSWLAVEIVYAVTVRPFYFDDRNPIVGITVDIRTHNAIDLNCRELGKLGIELRGKYVQHEIPRYDPRTRSPRKLVGRVLDLTDDFLILDDHLEGIDRIELENAFLEPRMENVVSCLRSLFGQKADLYIKDLRKRKAGVYSGEGKIARLSEFGKYLSSVELEIVPGLRVKPLGMLSQNGSGLKFPKIAKVPKTTYIFDASGTKADTWHDRGLDNYGPYDHSVFSPTQPVIAVLCEPRFKGRVEEFLRQFRDGISLSGKGRNPYSKGFLRKYLIDDLSFRFVEAKADTASAYKEAAIRAIENAVTEGVNIDLAFVQIQERHHQLIGNDNPYFVTKALFLSKGIPDQAVEIETMMSNQYQLGYVLNNIGLATYAKLSGTPWLLPSSQAIAHEFVFGLGSAIVGDGRFGARERYVGITTVFTGDGKYILENRTKAVKFEEYGKSLLETVKETISAVRTQFNWKDGSFLRLVFHVFKPMKDEEINVVKQAVAELEKYQVEFAFLHVIGNHSILIFDEHNKQGFPDIRGTMQKGKFAPERGLFIIPGKEESILVLTGGKEVKTAEDGLPQPVLLKLHKDSTFRDMIYLTRQTYTFSCHSWRTFSPSPLPVTILYSELIAKLLANLNFVSGWNSDAIVGKIGRTRWFL